MSGSTATARSVARDAVTDRDPVFVAGLDRSGKTTMAAFLTSHPSIAIPPVGSNIEMYFYRRFGDLAEDANLDRCLSAMLRYKHVRLLQPDGDAIRRAFRDGAPTYERLFALVLAGYADREGKRRWGAQTGLIERHADMLFTAYPRARIVHMVRDPRDRYEASLAAWPDGRGRAGGATARWRYSVDLAERNLVRHADGYLLVRFEDLVLDPEATLRRVLRFLDEPFDPEILEMTGAAAHREKLGRHGDPGRLLSPSFIGGFRGRIAPRELAFIQSFAGRRMRRLGYVTEPTPMGARERAGLLVDVPSQLGRMLAWRGAEELRVRFPTRFGRELDARMIVGPEGGPS
jgi:hypothetical protein